MKLYDALIAWIGANEGNVLIPYLTILADIIKFIASL